MSMASAADVREEKKPWALKNLPPFPAVALKLLEALSHDDTEIKQVVQWINADPAFAAELLRVANSPLYGFSYQIQSVRHAAVTLGLDFVKALSMTVAMRAYLRTALKTPVLRRCWRHSLATALLAERLAAACSGHSEGFYTAGLLHDVGRIGLLASYPAEYANLLSVSAEHALDVLDCERDLFDLDHCQAGAWLAEEWKLPPELGSIAAHHHAEPEPGATDQLALVRLACRLSEALDFGVVKTREGWTLERVRSCLPERARQRMETEAEELRSLVTNRIDALS